MWMGNKTNIIIIKDLCFGFTFPLKPIVSAIKSLLKFHFKNSHTHTHTNTKKNKEEKKERQTSLPDTTGIEF